MRVVMVMPCPKCGAEVGYLLCYTTEYNIYTYDGEYDLEDPYIEEEVFKCPECREVVATTEREAKTILGLSRREVAA
jgi:predicted RNA-binding Zn-ribbon protein involved in translation (DUF1610 family)